MKLKAMPKQRNHLVALVRFRKAGAHIKSNKAVRRAEKQNLWRMQ